MPKDNEVDEKVIWSDDLAAVLEAASEASQVPLIWLANQDFSPEQTKAWLCEAVDATVEEGAFSGSLHQVAEEGTGHVVAFTGCGPKSAANAKFLIGCAHFILKHRDSLSDHAATVAELRAEAERLREANQLYSFAMNTACIDELKRRADAAERRVGELEEELRQAMELLAYATYHDGRYNQRESEKFQRPAYSLLVKLAYRFNVNPYDSVTGADPT